ncbi:MAG: hypothetical protein AMR96_00290 [Candidatus Adiutrix intracellularis]|nr:MAG: hypothetical protein AMR96_00290 [Candidatus Adiutrix intracellularis]
MSLPADEVLLKKSELNETTVLETAPRAERPNFLTATCFADFDLPPEIMAGVDRAGFEYCTPIQAQAIPVAMSGLDIAGQAQTGTGKTTAFLIPLLNRLLKNKPLGLGLPRAIIITPTRELAMQIYEDAKILAGATSLRPLLVIGGMDYREQAELLATGPELVICTPGRIIDYLQQGIFKTKAIEVAVVDEADRLLDMGFIKDLKFLLGHLPSYTQRQTMLFSATLDDRVLELTYQFMNPPQFITAEPDKLTKIKIEQELYHLAREEKLPLIMGLLKHEIHRRVIIFVNTKSGVEWLAKKLTLNGFQAEGITGDLPQPKRLKLMEAFKENRLQILVATDVASRGIHVDDVSHVYNYDLPQDAENYIHRIGRTARAGCEGKAVSFGCEDYVFHLEAIENLLGEKIPVYLVDPELFQKDQAGEVRLKDQHGDRRKLVRSSQGCWESGSRESGREGRGSRMSRDPAQSQRVGGIFGLSPRFNFAASIDERQCLSWSVPPVTELSWAEQVQSESSRSELVRSELSRTETAEPTVEETLISREGSGYRRKRRRSNRGREAIVAPPDQPAPAEVVFERVVLERTIPEKLSSETVSSPLQAAPNPLEVTLHPVIMAQSEPASVVNTASSLAASPSLAPKPRGRAKKSEIAVEPTALEKITPKPRRPRVLKAVTIVTEEVHSIAAPKILVGEAAEKKPRRPRIRKTIPQPEVVD